VRLTKLLRGLDGFADDKWVSCPRARGASALLCAHSLGLNIEAALPGGELPAHCETGFPRGPARLRSRLADKLLLLPTPHRSFARPNPFI
jgi:hypothetical protein